MKIAYLILAHKNPEQLMRLISRLQSDSVDFFIHVDKKSDFSNFKCLFLNDSHSNIYFTKREKCSWGRIGIVKGTLHALKTIVNTGKNHDYIILLTGQDYPVKTNEFIKDYLRKNYGKIFMRIFELPNTEWDDEYNPTEGGLNRIKQYHFVFMGKPYVYPRYEQNQKIKDKLLNVLFGLRFHFPRKFPDNLKPFGGFAWWGIPKNAADYILSFTKSHPEYLRYYEHTLIPSEMFFQTILANSKNKEIVDNLTCQDIHYMDWKYKKNPDNPKTLQEEDINSLIGTDKLFARKFDVNIDRKIFDLIDEKCLI